MLRRRSSSGVAATASTEWFPLWVACDPAEEDSHSQRESEEGSSRRQLADVLLYAKTRFDLESGDGQDVQLNLLVTDLIGVWALDYNAERLRELNAGYNPNFDAGDPTQLLHTLADNLNGVVLPELVSTRTRARFRCRRGVDLYADSNNHERRQESGATNAVDRSHADCHRVLSLSFQTRVGNASVPGESFLFQWRFDCLPLAADKAAQADNPSATLALYAARFLRESFIRPLTAISGELARQHEILLGIIKARDASHAAELERAYKSAGRRIGAAAQQPFDSEEFISDALDSAAWRQALEAPTAPFAQVGIVAKLHDAYHEAHFGAEWQREALGREFEFFYDPAAEDVKNPDEASHRTSSPKIGEQSTFKAPQTSNADGFGPSMEPDTQHFSVEPDTQRLAREVDLISQRESLVSGSMPQRKRPAPTSATKSEKGQGAAPQRGKVSAPPHPSSAHSPSQRLRDEAAERRRREELEERLAQAREAKAAKKKGHKRSKFI